MQVITRAERFLLLTAVSLLLTSVTLGSTISSETLSTETSTADGIASTPEPVGGETSADDQITVSNEATDFNETATTTEQTTGTTTPQDLLVCDTCNSSSIEVCLAANNLVQCELESACFVNATWATETTYVTAGCTSDISGCNFESHDDCIENQTDCFLCCDTRRCNRDILQRFYSKPAPAATTLTPVDTVEQTLEPADTTPEPVGTTPEPVGTTPELVGTTPEPVFTTPEPVVTTPELVVTVTQKPEAVETTIELVDTTPEPVGTTPELVGTVTQKPEAVETTLEPVGTTPEPVETTPEPVVTTPELVDTVTQNPEAVETTLEPFDTTPQPEATAAQTSEPVPEASEPVATTLEPDSTVTQKPESIETTFEPADTTLEPVNSTPEPVVTTPASVPETPEPVATTQQPASAITTSSDSNSTSTEPGNPPMCYTCTPGSAEFCMLTGESQLDCPLGSVCFVNITRFDESNETYSMGCTLETRDCLFNVTLTDGCPNNETSCLLCCDDDGNGDNQYCNVDILDKLLPTTTGPSTATPPPPVDEGTTPAPATPETTGEPSEHNTSAAVPPAEETPVVSTSVPVQETTASSESGTTPALVEPEITEEVPSTVVPPTTVPPTAGPSTVIHDETSSPPETTTTESSKELECYTCTPGSRDDCIDSFGSLLCPTESICFLNITSIGDPWNETYSMGCMPNTGDCSSVYNSSSPVACPENETECLLCCNWKWCNTHLFPKISSTTGPSTPTPAPPIPTESPESQTVASTSQSPTTQTPPATDSPTTQPPGTESPTTQAPETHPPGTESPTTQPPGTEFPTTQAPGTESPTTESPKVESPTTETPPLSTSIIGTSKPDSPLPESPTTARQETNSPPEVFTTSIPSASPSTPAVTFPATSELPELDNSTAIPSVTPSSTATATVAPSTGPTTPRTTPLICYECINDEPSEFCNQTASDTHCDDINEVCRWSITNKDGVYTSSKGCIEREECQQLVASNNDSCSDYLTVPGKCNWCCEDADFCNYDRGTYSPTAAPPVSGSCDLSVCLLQFQVLVAQASKEPDLFFNEFCRSVPLVFACLANTSEACGYCDGGQREWMEAILANMTAQCPIACDAVAGFNCTLTFYYEIIEVLSQGGNCLDIYEIVYISEKCRVRTVGSCDADVRDNIDIAYTAIKSEVNTTCDATQPVFPPLNGTGESPYCNVSLCMQCIVDLGDIILFYFNKTGGDIFHVCDAIAIHYDCYLKYSSACSNGTRNSLEAAWKFTLGLISEECSTKVCDTTKARTCIVDLMTLIETKKDIQGACRSINDTKNCVADNTEGCAPDEQESLNRTLQYTLDLIGDQCKENVQVNINDTIEICEGGDAAQISFTFLHSPEAICGDAQNCKVFIDVEIEAGNSPLCANKKPIRQAVVVRTPGSGTSDDGLCSFDINEDNWDKVNNISIAAKIDFKYDKLQKRQLIIWYRKTINGETVERRSLANSTLYICDRDRPDSMCSSVNDPHIKTFDGWYFNNFLEGFFILYRHDTLPYEVQIATQRCNGQASCNCAVAVRCGDTVVYIDKCRKKGFVQKWCFGKDKYSCDNVMKIHLFGHDRMTPGMRVFSKNNGKLYYVWLPHGQTIKITIDGKYLSVWITPSPYDIGSVQGLCGNYDGISTNDLMYRNQTLYLGDGYNKIRGQPKGFCKEWQASLLENIYSGVAKNPYVPDIYCECDGSPKNSSVLSMCNYNALVETCDMERSDIEILPPFEYSNSEVDNDDHNGNGNNRRRRQAEDPLADYDVDETFNPPNITEDPAAIDAANKQCQEFFNNITVAQQCQNNSVANFTTSIAGCVDDILATNSMDYMTAALEALKTQCTAELTQNPVLANSSIASDIAKANCLNQCTNPTQGTCVDGVCHCNNGFSGDDCGFVLTAQPQYVEIYNSLCDLKVGGCPSAQVTGVGFIPNITTCQIQSVRITENGVVPIDEIYKQSPSNFISPEEVHCNLDSQTSANVRVANSGEPSAATLILVYDSTCYSCTQLPTVTCVRVKNSCIIDTNCYGPGQENPADKCMICRPESSDSTWTHNSDSESCSSQNNIPLIVGLCVGLGGGLILLTIIIVFIVYKVRCADSKELMTPEEYESVSRGSVHRSSDFAYDNIFQSTSDTDVAGSIRGGKFRYRDPPPDYEGKGTFNETFDM